MQKISFIKLLKNFNFKILKKLFFLLSLSYFCFYFFKNFDQISFNINFARNGKYIFISFLFCILSIFLNALAWENIVIWFGKNKNNINIYFPFLAKFILNEI
jgi:hypothetical protein